VTSASKTGLQLDPGNATDQQIISRQVTTARQAGRDGLDRSSVTQGRTDLESAYDDGVQAAAADEDQDDEAPAEDAAAGSGGGARNTGPGWSSFKPTSPARPPRHLADAGGFMGGLALYTFVVIYIRYGPAGWHGWLKAKFLNQPMTSTKTTTGKGTKLV
jgi:hypothetical protein